MTDTLYERMNKSVSDKLKADESDNPHTGSASTTIPQKKRGQSLASQLTELVESQGHVLFHDQYNEAHIVLPSSDVHGVRLRSKEFRRWLQRLGWTEIGKAISGESIQSTIGVLEGKALFEGMQRYLHVRVAMHNDEIYYDLGDRRVIHLTPNGWDFVEKPPVLFRRLSHQRKQVEPVRGADWTDILKFVNVTDSSTKRYGLILLAWIVAAFIPGFPHPPLVVHGPQGSAKSTLFKVLKTLLDPSELASLSPPTSLQDFTLIASSHWFLPLDNLSTIPEWLSDALCRTCTGAGFSKRELYSDADEVIFSIQRVLGINGINLVVDKPDLLDRSLLLEMQSIDGQMRRCESAFWQEFEAARPRLLGAICDVLVGALREYQCVQMKSMPRMADFARWGSAITQACGIKMETFLDAYNENILTQHEEAIDASTVAQAMLKFMETRQDWNGSPSGLLCELKKVADQMNIETWSKSWPKESNWLWRRIVPSLSNLEAMGLNISKDSKRIITVRKAGQNAANAATTATIINQNTPSGTA